MRVTEWEDLGILGCAPLSELQGQGRGVFHGQREDLFACLPAIPCSGVGLNLKSLMIPDIRHQKTRFQLQHLKHIVVSLLFSFLSFFFFTFG